MSFYRVGIYGYGAHARDIEVLWNTKKPLWPMESFDDKNGPKIDEADSDLFWFLGVHNPQTRATMSERLPGSPAIPLIHSSAVIDQRSEFARGVVIEANTTIMHEVSLGLHTHVNYNVGMTRTRVGDFCTIAPGATICGDVIIGDRVFIGAGATVCNLVTIGDDVVIGAGAVVLPGAHVPAEKRVIGTWGSQCS